MLKDLNLPSLQDKQREKRLVLLCKIAEGLIPAIPAESFLTPDRKKRQIKTTSRSDFTSNNIIRRFARNNSRCFLFGQCKNRHLQKQLLHQNCFRLEQPHRRSSVCKVGRGVSIPHLDSTLSDLPVFPSTFMPGHGQSRRNYQDQDQDLLRNRMSNLRFHVGLIILKSKNKKSLTTMTKG